MADAEALADLGLVLLWVGAFILASLAFYLAKAVESALRHIPLLGGVLAGVAATFESAVVDPLDKLRKGAESEITRGLSGLLDSLAVLVGLAALLGLGVKAALEYMWNHSLEARVVSWIAREISKIHLPHIDVAAITRAITATILATVRADIAAVRRDLAKAEAVAASATTAALHTAERYADTAVAALRTAEDAAIADAARIAHQAEGEAAGAVSAAVAAAQAVAVPVEHELNALDAYIKSLGLTALVASIPALATLVNALAVETGLENAECRGKVKQICGTDPNAWSDLLGGLAAIGFAFSLRELYDLARPVVDELKPVIETVAG